MRAFILLGLTITCFGPARAQKAANVKSEKAKTKTTATSSTAVAKDKAVAVSNEPQPVSPVASAPQVIMDATPGVVPAEGLTGWLTDLGAAQAQAKAANRPIVAVFSGSDWCKPCIMYEQEVFAKPEFAEYAKDKLVLAHFDFPRLKKNQPSAAQLKLNEAAAAQLNREGDFPLAVVIAPDGKVLAKTGYIAGGPAAFEAYLKKVVPSL
ncbi:thioredoxin family protein [Hymenobacter negativus]|uniref:Thioredoxin family protein n=1 Tax=Hymenobacter negativus TaxID=2795026 RepID=A0ABS3QJX1_9BACT|nr:thioredoxin family protein [Hymenobacter negativus]MBO2011391.1 thioredoxin family protein [Hymenobacter negativus]